ncbi:phoE Broad specificity phosphatase PhoE and related phosphatases [Rhabdaerophilaceae bacterium]
MPTLYFLRHGETDWNVEGRLQGQTEIGLNSKGRRQAAGIAHAIRQGRIAGLDVATLASMPFYASPMTRTVETMAIVRDRLGLPNNDFTQDNRLKEISFGAWEGKTWREIRACDAGRSRSRDRDKWGFVPPGGESYEMVRMRVAEWLETIDQDICVVAHGGIARVLLVLLAGMSADHAITTDVWQGKLLEIRGSTHAWRPGPGHLEP